MKSRFHRKCVNFFIESGIPLTPNHSLNRTHCGMRLKALHFILGL